MIENPNEEMIQVRLLGEAILLSLGDNAIELGIEEAAVLTYQLQLALKQVQNTQE